MSSLPIVEVLFFLVPAVGTILLCVPLVWLLPRWNRITAPYSIPAALLLAFAFAVFLFVFWSVVFLGLMGVPGDENAGEVVVLYLEIAASCAVLGEVAYWVIWWRWHGQP